MRKIVLMDKMGTVDKIVPDTFIVDSSVFLNSSVNEELMISRCKEFLNSISHNVVEGKTISEWYRYRNASLWWFVYRRVWHRIEECIRFIENLKKILDDNKPELVIIKGFYDKIDLIKQVCNLRNIKVKIPFLSLQKIVFPRTLKPRLWRILVGRVNRITRKKKAERVRLYKNLSRQDFSFESIQDCVIYLAGGNYRKDIYDWREGKVVSGEHLVQLVLEQVKNEKKLLCIDVDNFYLSKGNDFLEKRLRDSKEYWIPFELFLTNDLEREHEASIKALIKSILALYHKRDFHNAFKYQDISLWSSLDLLFKALLAETYLPSYILSIEAATNLLSKAKVRSIFLPFETGVYAMAFSLAAEELGIKSFGIQHGIIHKANYEYSVDDIKTTKSEMGCPIPSYLLVFGEFYRKLLVEVFSYPKERVIVVGNPSYENISTDVIDSQKGDIYLHFGLDPSKKTVLLTTTMHQTKYGRVEYDVLIVQSLVESFAKNKEVQILVKTHPLEDPSAYLKIINEKGATNFRVVEDYPIQPLISICDVFVSVLSTTIFEAMIMNKPVIIAEVSEKIHRDMMSVAESGAAIRSSFSDLPNTILRLLNDSSLRKDLSIRSMEVVKSHFNYPTSDVNAKIAKLLIRS